MQAKDCSCPLVPSPLSIRLGTPHQLRPASGLDICDFLGMSSRISDKVGGEVMTHVGRWIT